MGSNLGLLGHLGVLLLLCNLFLRYDCGYVCPQGWTLIPNSPKCLKMLKTSRDWPSARKHCKQLDGDLLTIRNAATQAFVVDLAKRHNYKDVWIGANDRAKEGRFVWLDEKTPIIFEAFPPGEPNDQAGKQDCAYLRAESKFIWDDHTCAYKKGFACERPAVDYTCTGDWIQIPGFKLCIKFHHLRATWENARKTCKRHGADLVTIRDSETNEAVVELLKANLNNLWIGLNDRKEENKFVWLDETTPTTFEFWGEGEPNNFRTENCVYIEAGRDFKWNDIPCDSLSAFSCARPAEIRNDDDPFG